jgi:hypothetical protein
VQQSRQVSVLRLLHAGRAVAAARYPEAAHFVQRVGEHSEDITENRDEKLLIKHLCNVRPVCATGKE